MRPDYEVVAVHEETTNKIITKVKVTRRGNEYIYSVADVVTELDNDSARFFCNSVPVVARSLPLAAEDSGEVSEVKRNNSYRCITTVVNATDSDKLKGLPVF